MAIRVIYYKLSCKVQINLECYRRQRYQRNTCLGVTDTSLDHPQQLFQAHPQTYNGALSGSDITLHLGAKSCIVCIHAVVNTL